MQSTALSNLVDKTTPRSWLGRPLDGYISPKRTIEKMQAAMCAVLAPGDVKEAILNTLSILQTRDAPDFEQKRLHQISKILKVFGQVPISEEQQREMEVLKIFLRILTNGIGTV